MPVIRPIMLPKTVTLLALTLSSTSAEDVSKQIARGKSLYEGAAGCFACHQNNGIGVDMAIPPLAGSDWLKGSPERTIHLIRYGLQGGIKVNGKDYNGLMPPQAQLSSEQIADVITYIGSSWGNQAKPVNAAQVDAVKYLGSMDQKTLLETYPFPDRLKAHNGISKLIQTDAPIDPETVTVVRTLMPGASPAAIAVALPGPQYYCWDAGECRLRYVWTKGGFIQQSKEHWSSNGKPVPLVEADPYYRSRNSMISEDQIGNRNEQNHKNPIYDTTQAKDFPFTFEGLDAPRPKFKGYSLIEGHPEFIYEFGDQVIRERIVTSKDKSGIDRHFTINGPSRGLTFQLAEHPDASFSCSAGTVEPDVIRIPANASRQFIISIKEVSP